jgi:putative heme iron utilization protein
MVLDIRLELGDRSESVTAEETSAGSALNTTDATKGSPFNTRAILQLPLEGRNVAGLLSLQSGVTFLTDNPLSKDIRNGSVNGAQTNQSNITLDGVDVNDQESRLPFTSALRTTLDSVQEFRW